MFFNFCIVFFCFQVNGSQLDLEIVQFKGPMKRLTVSSDGSFLALDNHSLYWWDERGRFLRNVPYQQTLLSSLLLNDRLYFSQIENGVVNSYSVGSDGRVSVLNYPVPSFINVIDGRLFASQPVKLLKEHGYSQFEIQERYPYFTQANEVFVDPDRGEIRDGDFAFGKINDFQKKFLLNFHRIWVARDEDKILLVNQVEPRVYSYTDLIVKAEKSEGLFKAGTIPFKVLKLPEYRKPSGGLWQSEKNQVFEEGAPSYRAWYNNLQLIEAFGALGEGFVIVYRIPDEVGYKLLAQPLNRNLKLVGDPFFLNNLAGVALKRLYGYQKNFKNGNMTIRISIYHD